MDFDSIDARIARLFRDNDNIFDLEQARAVRISSSCLSRRVAWGTLGRPFSGVFVPGALAHDEETCLRLGLRVGGPGCAIASITSARLQVGWDRSTDRRLHFISTSRHNRGYHPDFMFHQTAALPERDVIAFQGKRMLSMTRTCHHMGTAATRHQITFVMRSADRLGLLDIEYLRFLTGDFYRGPGNGVVRGALGGWDAGSAGTRSGSEDLFVLGSERYRLPEPAVNVRGVTGLPDVEPDFAYPGLRKVIEIDGGDHDTDAAKARDAEIDARHRERRIDTLRLPSTSLWRDLRGTMDAAARFLAS